MTVDIDNVYRQQIVHEEFENVFRQSLGGPLLRDYDLYLKIETEFKMHIQRLFASYSFPIAEEYAGLVARDAQIVAFGNCFWSSMKRRFADRYYPSVYVTEGAK